MTLPTLVVVSGTPGSGKTTLAHALAREIGCPVISRDEIKEGIVHAAELSNPEWGGPVSLQTFRTFFDVMRLLLDRGTTIVAEAAFKHELWAPDLIVLAAHAKIRIIHCNVTPEVARERLVRRLASAEASRAAHPDALLIEALDNRTESFAAFDAVTLDVPTLRVDTTDGYVPDLPVIVDFVNHR